MVPLGHDQPPETLEVEDHHGQNGAELDDDVEAGRLLPGITEQMAHQNEVAGGGHGQVFGQAFNKAQQDGGQGVDHGAVGLLTRRSWPAALPDGGASCNPGRARVLHSERGDAMTTILPQGELMRRAVTWIDGQRAETGQSYAALIEAAALRFNLSPKDADFLQSFFKEQREARQD